MGNAQYEIETGTEGSARSGRRVIYLIVIALIAFGIWAANAPLEEIIRGEGSVVPKTSTQVVQNLEGGIVDAIFVMEVVLPRFSSGLFRAMFAMKEIKNGNEIHRRVSA